MWLFSPILSACPEHVNGSCLAAITSTDHCLPAIYQYDTIRKSEARKRNQKKNCYQFSAIGRLMSAYILSVYRYHQNLQADNWI